VPATPHADAVPASAAGAETDTEAGTETGVGPLAIGPEAESGAEAGTEIGAETGTATGAEVGAESGTETDIRPLVA
jgi:propionyl-CoA carboxylase alpha chain